LPPCEGGTGFALRRGTGFPAKLRLRAASYGAQAVYFKEQMLAWVRSYHFYESMQAECYYIIFLCRKDHMDNELQPRISQVNKLLV
jgi:hypothetical protein